MRLPATGFPLFKLFGIQVFLHWSWIVMAMFELRTRNAAYSAPGWNVAEYLSIFVIVTLHEFGHALACRSVGGAAEQILLWPLGGIAFVRPPNRPGAVLWSIAAGPLVNVVLLPILWGLAYAMPSLDVSRDATRFVDAVAFINTGLLIFNILPIYPLDGGQILRSVLWFFVGPATSLLVACVIGLLGSTCGLVLALVFHNTYLVFVAAFAAWQSWIGFQAARASLAIRTGRVVETG